MEALRPAWKNLLFTGIDPMIVRKRRNEWLSVAEHVLTLLPSGNIAVVGETSIGKTVIALLAAVGGNFRTCFLVPERELAEQHRELLHKLVGDQVASQILTGGVPCRKRDWRARCALLTFATPETLRNDCRRGLVSVADFDLLVFDEFHHAQGEYAYVPVVELAHRHGVRVIGLGPTPGSKRMEITALRDRYRLVRIIEPTIETPTKTEALLKVALDDPLRRIDANFRTLLSETARELQALGFRVDPDRPLMIRQLNHLRQVIAGSAGAVPDDSYYDALSTHARAYKLLFAHITALAECYATFLEYVDRLWATDRTAAAASIRANPSFNEIVEIAREHRDNHPKVARFLSTVRWLHGQGKRALVFVSQKATARYLKARLESEGIAADTMFGGRDRKRRQLAQTLQRLESGELAVVIATSVIEEGVNIPEVDVVIHYSVPMTRTSRVQRSGRTGRVREGNVFFICLDHPMDMVFYWVTRNGARSPASSLDRTGDRLRAFVQDPFAQKIKVPQQYIHHRHRPVHDPNSLDLFRPVGRSGSR